MSVIGLRESGGDDRQNCRRWTRPALAVDQKKDSTQPAHSRDREAPHKGVLRDLPAARSQLTQAHDAGANRTGG